MGGSFFRALDEVDGRGRQAFEADEACIGPWSTESMHGGPPSALLVRACEQAVARQAGNGMIALRTAAEFLAPVPQGPVQVSAEVVRPGRRIALARATLTAGNREVLQARSWLIRTLPPEQAQPELDPAGAERPAATPPEQCPPALEEWDFPYRRALEWRVAAGDPSGSGDAACWARQRIPLVPGEQPSGMQRAVLIADSGNGISAALDWARWTFVNVDLTVHLRRPVTGEWVLLDARSRYWPAGTGLATSGLSDLNGPVGVGAQTLLVLPREP